MTGNPAAGFGYLWRGFQLLRRPGLRRYVVIPLLLNAAIFATLLVLGLTQFSQWLQVLLDYLPGWLGFLHWILWPLAALLVLIGATFASSILANLLAAPFNGLLAARVEALLTGNAADAEGFGATVRDIPRALGKELRKIIYYLPRALLVLTCSFIPPLYPLVPVMWFWLGSWMMAVGYCDYPMDNHRYSLSDVRQRIGREQLTSFGFGAAVLLGTMVPLLNFFVMPAAVCAATLYWVEKLRPEACAAPI